MPAKADLINQKDLISVGHGSMDQKEKKKQLTTRKVNRTRNLPSTHTHREKCSSECNFDLHLGCGSESIRLYLNIIKNFQLLLQFQII